MRTTAELLEGRTRFEAVSGLYRNTRQESFFWFAFWRPIDWVQLDAETRSNGAIYVEIDGIRHGVLVVDGAVALKTPQYGPGHRRLHAMVEHDMNWTGPPQLTEPTVWDGREAIRCQWQQDKISGEALFDATSGLVVRTAWPDETVELTGLRFDDDVDASVFVPPERTLDGWRGGTAVVQHDQEAALCSASWSPASGPGDLHVAGPEGVTLDEAMHWARMRTEDIRVSEVRKRS